MAFFTIDKMHPELSIHVDMSHGNTDGQNKADQGATKSRNEAYLRYAAVTRRGSNEGRRNYVRLYKSILFILIQLLVCLLISVTLNPVWARIKTYSKLTTQKTNILPPKGLISKTIADEETKAKKLKVYKPHEFGSMSEFNPLTFILNGGLDTTQQPKVFSTDNFGDNAKEVFENITHPIYNVDEGGGFWEFTKVEIIGLHSVPNWTLHFLGNGLSFKMNEEWFYFNGFSRPYTYLLSFITVFTAGFMNETVEKVTLPATDTIADLLLFDPLGMVVFGFDAPSEFIMKTLKPSFWHYQPVYDPISNKLLNVGLNYAFRPNFFDKRVTPFAYVGMAALFGSSLEVKENKKFSLGIGMAITDPLKIEGRLCTGLFYDEDGSLITSILVNGTDNLLFRLNIYPNKYLSYKNIKPSLFFGFNRYDYSPTFGFGISLLPIGFGYQIEKP